MATIMLKDAMHSPFMDEFIGKDMKRSADEINDVLRKHVSIIGRGKNYSYADADHHYLCSTIMDSVFSSGAVDPCLGLAKEYKVIQSFTHAYECACWGYCLKYHVEHKSEQKYFAISIIDVNSMEMKYWSSNEQWGKSGFGVTTLFFEVVDDNNTSDLLETGMASGGNNIIAFVSAAKLVAKKFKANMLSLPFFPESMSVPIRRSLKGIDLLSERHAIYGHTFGSDPWIAFICDHAEHGLRHRNITFGSLALRGYYCFANVLIAADVSTHHF